MNILITGASRGIGREFVTQFLKNNSVRQLWVVTQNAEKLNSIVADYSERVKVIATSVSEPESRGVIEKALENTSIDLLINNAGTYFKEPDNFTELNLEE